MTRTPNLQRVKLARFSPFRTPAWRFDQATELFSQGCRPRELPEDSGVKLALRYILAIRDDPDDATAASVMKRLRNLTVARRIHAQADATRDEIEARLLAGESPWAIAAKTGVTGVTAGVVKAYERFIFNVADSLRAMDWLLLHAVGVEKWREQLPTRRDLWCYIAIAAGPVVLDHLIAEDLDRDEPRHPDRTSFALRARWILREYAASWWPESYDLQAILMESDRVFADVNEAARGTILGNQLRFVRAVAGLPPDTGVTSDREPTANGFQLSSPARPISKEIFNG